MCDDEAMLTNFVVCIHCLLYTYTFFIHNVTHTLYSVCEFFLTQSHLTVAVLIKHKKMRFRIIIIVKRSFGLALAKMERIHNILALFQSQTITMTWGLILFIVDSTGIEAPSKGYLFFHADFMSWSIQKIRETFH